MIEYRAPELKRIALHWLREQYPDAVLMEELALASFGASSVDVAAITAPDDGPAEIIGVEVKGDGDSAARLELQGPAYGMAATRMWLLPSPSLAKACRKKRPPLWGMLRIDSHSPFTESLEVEEMSAELGCQSPEVLAMMLWRKEIEVVCSQNSIKVDRAPSVLPSGKKIFGEGLPPTKSDFARCLVETLPLPRLRDVVVRTIYHRNWEGSMFRAANGEKNKIVWRPGDALPEIKKIATDV